MWIQVCHIFHTHAVSCGAQKSASHKLTPNPSRPRESPSECAAPSTPCDSQVRMDVVVTKVAIYKETVCTTDTSTTAQGGGGSFKNRKPIGEVGCCESRMEE